MSQYLMLASCSIVFVLGAVHLAFTFVGVRLKPRDTALEESMKRVSPIITQQTSMWNAWIGFNASHSFGAMLFGLVYGYLAWFQAPILFESMFLQFIGLVLLTGYVVLGYLYWFSVPFRGVVAAWICYVVALGLPLLHT